MAVRRNSSVQAARRQESARYIYGNAVRKAEAQPWPDEHRKKQKPKKPVSQQVKKNRKQALHMSRAYVVFLAVAAVITLAACVWFLQIRADLVSRSERISVMQQELADLKEENTSRYNAVMDSVNLEEVRERAMNDLGMVKAAPGQIVSYQNPLGNHVKQYESIPKNGVLAQSNKTTK